jgi:hypothetical protein
MDKPAQRAIPTMKTRPKQPEAPSLFVLDPVIIADRIHATRAFRLPPFLGYPLRSIGTHDPMPAPPPRETKRRIIRQEP